MASGKTSKQMFPLFKLPLRSLDPRLAELKVMQIGKISGSQNQTVPFVHPVAPKSRATSGSRDRSRSGGSKAK